MASVVKFEKSRQCNPCLLLGRDILLLQLNHHHAPSSFIWVLLLCHQWAHHRFHKIPYVTLSRSSWIQCTPSHISKSHFNVIVPSLPRLPMRSLSFEVFRLLICVEYFRSARLFLQKDLMFSLSLHCSVLIIVYCYSGFYLMNTSVPFYLHFNVTDNRLVCLWREIWILNSYETSWTGFFWW
jgi:hypothetical protein